MNIKNVIRNQFIILLMLCNSCNSNFEFVTGSINFSRIESIVDGNTNIATFSQIVDLAIDEENNFIYILDILKKDDINNKYIIRKLNNNVITTIYQSEVPIYTIKFNDGYLYISSDKGISRLDKSNIPELIIAVDKEKITKDGRLSDSSLSNPVLHMDFDNNGILYIINSLIPSINKLGHRILLRKLNLKEGNIESYDKELFYSHLDDKNLDSLNIWSLNIDKSTNRIYFYNFISGNLPIPDKITEINLEKGIVDYSVNKLLDMFIGNFIFDNIGNFYIITYKDNKSYIYRIVKNTNKRELLAETDNRLNYLLVDNKNNLICVVASNNKIFKVKI